MRRLIPMLIALLVLTSCAASYAEVLPTDAPAVSASPVAAASTLPESSPTPLPEPTEEIYEGNIIAEEALQYLGYNYIWGAENPREGFDCSGLVYFIYKNHGYRLMRVAEDQSHQGEAVENLDDLLPGDLVCFKKGNYCGHIGIYIGEGKFVHATDMYGAVVVTELEEYAKRYNVEARRIIGSMEKKSLEEIEKEEQEFLALLEAAERAKAAQATPSPMPTPEGGSTKTDENGPVVFPPKPTDPPQKTPEPTDNPQDQSENTDTPQTSDPPQQSDPPSEDSVPNADVPPENPQIPAEDSGQSQTENP